MPENFAHTLLLHFFVVSKNVQEASTHTSPTEPSEPSEPPEPTEPAERTAN